MDLFIIIAAVLGVGGIVTASVYGLVNSASSSTSILITQVSASGAPSASTTIPVFSITIKNTGSSTITCAGSTCSVALQGSATTATCPTASNMQVSGGVSGGTAPAWLLPVATCTTTTPLTFSTTALVLPPGASVSLTAISTYTFTAGYVTGNQYTISVVLGASTASIKLTAQ